MMKHSKVHITNQQHSKTYLLQISLVLVKCLVLNKILHYKKLRERENEGLLGEATREGIAIGAIKYSILKQSPGKDIVFDFDTSLAVKGDSGPYLQYTYARLRRIRKKSGWRRKLGVDLSKIGILGLPIFTGGRVDVSKLTHDQDIKVIKKLLDFPDTLQKSTETLSPSILANYLYQLATEANAYYETVKILSDIKKSPERNARLLLVDITARTLKTGLHILGIKTPERI